MVIFILLRDFVLIYRVFMITPFHTQSGIITVMMSIFLKIYLVLPFFVRQCNITDPILHIFLFVVSFRVLLPVHTIVLYNINVKATYLNNEQCVSFEFSIFS